MEITNNNKISDRRGKVILLRRFLIEDADASILKALFSNFFPIDIVPNSGYGWHERIEYYGISPLFDIVEVGCIAPTYDALLLTKEDGSIAFDCFKKL